MRRATAFRVSRLLPRLRAARPVLGPLRTVRHRRGHALTGALFGATVGIATLAALGLPLAIHGYRSSEVSADVPILAPIASAAKVRVVDTAPAASETPAPVAAASEPLPVPDAAAAAPPRVALDLGMLPVLASVDEIEAAPSMPTRPPARKPTPPKRPEGLGRLPTP